MDFFEHQEKARKKTKVLVVYFVIAVACIIASIYLASVLILHGTQPHPQHGESPRELAFWDPEMFLYVTLGTLGVVVSGSLYKTAALAQGGRVVAESLGGRQLDPRLCSEGYRSAPRLWRPEARLYPASVSRLRRGAGAAVLV